MQPQWICPLIVVFLIVVFAVRIRRLDASFAVGPFFCRGVEASRDRGPPYVLFLILIRALVAVPTMPRVGSP